MGCTVLEHYKKDPTWCCSSIQLRIWPRQTTFENIQRCVRWWLMRAMQAWKPVPQVWHQRVGGELMEISAWAFLALRFSLAALDRWTSEWRAPLVSHASPGWFVRCCIFPCGDVDVKVLEVSFQGVFEVLALSPYLPSPLTKLTIQQLLGYSGVWRLEDVTCRACLCLAHGGDDAGELCPLQHLRVRYLVLPADVEDAV